MTQRDYTAAMLDIGPQKFLNVKLGYEIDVCCRKVTVLYPQKLHVYLGLCLLTETLAQLTRRMHAV